MICQKFCELFDACICVKWGWRDTFVCTFLVVFNKPLYCIGCYFYYYIRLSLILSYLCVNFIVMFFRHPRLCSAWSTQLWANQPCHWCLVSGSISLRPPLRILPIWGCRQAANVPQHIQAEAVVRVRAICRRINSSNRLYYLCSGCESQVRLS